MKCEKNPHINVQNALFLPSNLLAFSIGNNTRNLSGFSLEMGDTDTDLKMTCYHFLKTLNIRQNLHSQVIQILFMGM